MEAYLLDWANLLLRWVHVVTAIAWIGSSFYFVFLDNNLIKPTSPDLLEKGVDGAMWAVHGGGFYNPQKYMVAPRRIHTELHWFYWESYSTWLSGFALFTVLYLYHAGTFLIDRSLLDWSPLSAGAAALGFLVAFWLIYDRICQGFGFRDKGEVIVAALLLGVIGLACWLACQLFAGRAAFLLVGAMLATAMSANVFFWIIPGQRKVVAAMTSGEKIDPQALAIHGKRGKQRSVHNTYFTLPVLFAMLSNHYGFLYTHRWNWVILFLMMLAGAAIRQYFVQRHGWRHGRANHPWAYAVAGVGIVLAVIVGVKALEGDPNRTEVKVQTTSALNLFNGQDQVHLRQVLTQRCTPCHGAQVQMKNVRLDSAAGLQRNAQMAYQQVVVLRQMPMNNATAMTDEERLLLGRWFRAGAPIIP